MRDGGIDDGGFNLRCGASCDDTHAMRRRRRRRVRLIRKSLVSLDGDAASNTSDINTSASKSTTTPGVGGGAS